MTLTPMLPNAQNFLSIAAYVVGLLVSLPVLAVLWRVALFVAKAMGKLDQIDTIAADLKSLREDRADESFAVELSLTVIESDINVLQEKTGVPVRAFPDRRSGPADRRRA